MDLKWYAHSTFNGVCKYNLCILRMFTHEFDNAEIMILRTCVVINSPVIVYSMKTHGSFIFCGYFNHALGLNKTFILPDGFLGGPRVECKLPSSGKAIVRQV